MRTNRASAQSDFEIVTSDARIKWKKIRDNWRPTAAEFSQFQPVKLTKDVEYSSAKFTYLFDERVIDELLELDDSAQLRDPVKIAKELIWRTGDKTSQ